MPFVCVSGSLDVRSRPYDEIQGRTDKCKGEEIGQQSWKILENPQQSGDVKIGVRCPSESQRIVTRNDREGGADSGAELVDTLCRLQGSNLLLRLYDPT